MLKLLKINFILSILLFIFGILSISFFLKLSYELRKEYSNAYSKNDFINSFWLMFYEGKFLIFFYDEPMKKWIMLFFIPFIITFFILLAIFIISLFIINLYRINPKNNFALISGISGLFGGFLFFNVIIVGIAYKKEKQLQNIQKIKNNFY